MTLVKICGLTRAADVRAAEEAGASYGGVILAPDSRRTVAADAVPAIFDGSGLARCAVFVNQPLELIIDLVDRLGLAAVQLHGDEAPAMAARLRETTGIETWKAVRVRDAVEFIAAAELYAGSVDGLLLDGWSAAARGGTGTRFPWEEVALHRARLAPDLRLIVAGGLHPGNVGQVIELLAPDVVDVSSGVEASPGQKDPDLIRSFVEAAGAVATRKE